MMTLLYQAYLYLAITPHYTQHSIQYSDVNI